MTTLNLITQAHVAIDTIRRHEAVCVNIGAIPDLIANPSNHFLMDDERANLFIFAWCGPGVYNVLFTMTNDARMKPACDEATGYIRALKARILWAAERVEDPGSAYGMKMLGLRNAKQMALIAGCILPIWRRSFW